MQIFQKKQLNDTVTNKAASIFKFIKNFIIIFLYLSTLNFIFKVKIQQKNDNYRLTFNIFEPLFI